MIVKATNTINTQLMCISINQSNRVKTPIFVISNTAMLSNYEKICCQLLIRLLLNQLNTFLLISFDNYNHVLHDAQL